KLVPPQADTVDFAEYIAPTNGAPNRIGIDFSFVPNDMDAELSTVTVTDTVISVNPDDGTYGDPVTSSSVYDLTDLVAGADAPFTVSHTGTTNDMQGNMFYIYRSQAALDYTLPNGTTGSAVSTQFELSPYFVKGTGSYVTITNVTETDDIVEVTYDLYTAIHAGTGEMSLRARMNYMDESGRTNTVELEFGGEYMQSGGLLTDQIIAIPSSAFVLNDDGSRSATLTVDLSVDWTEYPADVPDGLYMGTSYAIIDNIEVILVEY
ncbi:MAG: hypothetical protein IJ362_03515, partial [Oscillospiraceae bacterium]|nr:hypothetical protein [Oscillospiraceae bacterium]